MTMRIYRYSGIPIFEPRRETKIGALEKSGVKLQCSPEERERLLVRVIGRFEKMPEGSRNRESTVYYLYLHMSVDTCIKMSFTKLENHSQLLCGHHNVNSSCFSFC